MNGETTSPFRSLAIYGVHLPAEIAESCYQFPYSLPLSLQRRLDLRRQCRRDSLDGGQVGFAGFADAAERSERADQGLAAFGADAGDRVQAGGEGRLGALLAVERDGEAVGLVADAL